MVKLLTIATIILTMISCKSKTDKEIGKYIYEDESYTIHVDRNCEGIASIEGKGYKGSKPVIFIKFSAFEGRQNGSYCSICVSDSHFEQLESKAQNYSFDN